MKLGDIGTFTKGAPLSKADISEKGTPFILYGELYTTYDEVTYEIKRKTDKIVSETYYSKIGDVIIPTSGETPEEIATATCVMLPDVILAGDLNIYRTSAVDGRIVSFIINHVINDKISKVAQGKSVVHVKAEEIGKISINYPNAKEQKKILSFLELLDKKIDKQKQLVESLKSYKRGVLSAVFSRKIRFKNKDGNAFPEWTSVRFSGLYKQVSEKNDGSFGTDKIISVANMYFKSDVTIGSDEYLKSYNICRLGDIAFEGNKSKNYSFGRLVENSIGDGIVSHVFIVFRPLNPNHNINYWKIAINYEPIMGKILAKCTKKSTMMTDLVPKDFLLQSILVPCFEEQQRIADYISIIDRKIDFEVSLLNDLLAQKSEFLRQLFI